LIHPERQESIKEVGDSPRTECRISIQSLPFQWVLLDRSLCCDGRHG
jgi:hypothetical protein